MRTFRILLFALVATLALSGCAQSQKTDSAVESGQGAFGRVDASAATAQDGPRGAINIVTNPHGLADWDASGVNDLTPEDSSADGLPEGDLSGEEDGDLVLAFTGHNYSITIENISQTIESTIGSEVAQTPSGTVAATQTVGQEVSTGAMAQEPRASTAIPITVSAAPGSSAQGGSTSAVGEGGQGGNISTEQAAENRFFRAQLKAQGDQLAELLKALEAFQLTAVPPTTQPSE